MAECKEVMCQLKSQQHTTWWIELKLLSSESLLTSLSDINECQVRGLYIENTHFDSNCVNKLAQVVTFNKTMEYLYLISSPLLPDTYYLLTTALKNNKMLKELYLFDDNNISHDIPHLCHLLANNTTLKVLDLAGCPNITKFDEQQIKNVLLKNKSLNYLYINDNFLRFNY